MQLTANSPVRAPDWVFRRAQIFVRDGTRAPSTAKDGSTPAAWMRRTVQFLRALETDATNPDYLADEFDDLYYAHALSTNSELLRDRLYLEAGILSGMGDKEIADRSCFTFRQIKAYEACFFNIRDVLHKDRYIVSRILGSPMVGGPGAVQPTIVGLIDLWRMYAYCRGFEMALAAMDNFVGIRHITGDVNAAMSRETIETIGIKALSTVKQFSPTSSRGVELLQTHAKHVEIASKAEDGGRADDIMSTALAELQRSLGISFRVENYEPKSGRVDIIDTRTPNNTGLEPLEASFSNREIMRRLDSAIYPEELLRLKKQANNP